MSSGVREKADVGHNDFQPRSPGFYINAGTGGIRCEDSSHRCIDHVGIVVNDLGAAKAFFLDFGLELLGEGELEGEWLDKIVGLKDVKNAYAFLRTPDGQANIELIHFYRPSDESPVRQPLANTPGIRHIAFVVEDIEAVVARLKEKGTEIFSEIQSYEVSYKLCYVRGPKGIILELAEQIK